MFDQLSAWRLKLDSDDLAQRRDALRELPDGPLPMTPKPDGT